MMALETLTLTLTTPPEAQPLDRNPAAVYLASLAPGSRRTMRQALDSIARVAGAADCLALDWPALRFQHTAVIRSWLADHYAPATANKMLAALRGCLKAAWRLGQMTAEDYQRAADMQAVRGERLPAGRALTAGEIGALFAAADRDLSPAGARDGAMLALLRAGGLRRAELCGLVLADYDAAAGVLRVMGKGNKQREIPVTNGTAERLAGWLAIRGQDAGALFCPVTQSGRLELRHMTTESLYQVLRRLADRASVLDFSPHDLRRTFISDLLEAGADIATAQRLAGHANVTTTARYDRRGEVAKRRGGMSRIVDFERARSLDVDRDFAQLQAANDSIEQQ